MRIEFITSKGKASQKAIVGGRIWKQRGSLFQGILNWWVGKDLGGFDRSN
jgi:hypothetical protein